MTILTIAIWTALAIVVGPVAIIATVWWLRICWLLLCGVWKDTRP